LLQLLRGASTPGFFPGYLPGLLRGCRASSNHPEKRHASLQYDRLRQRRAAHAQHQPRSGAEAKTPAANGWLGLEIRSVNSRFLDLTFRLPDELRRQRTGAARTADGASSSAARLKYARHIETGQRRPVVPEPSNRLLQRLSTACRTTCAPGCPTHRALSVADILRLTVPDETGQGHRSGAPKCWRRWPKTAVKELMTSREREGARLATA
jgi:uncharacterized protein YicC (UPF0701 family)